MVLRPSLVQRCVSSVVLWSVVLGIILSGWDVGSWLVICFFGLLGQWEFYHAQEEKGLSVYKYGGCAIGLLLFLNSLIFLVLVPHYAEGMGYTVIHAWIGVGAVLVLGIIGGLVRVVIGSREKPEGEQPIIGFALTIFGIMYVPFLFNYVALVAYWPERLGGTLYILLYLLAVTKFSDVGAFVFGSLFGRNKMSPGISPRKTWEGFVGGVVVSLGVSILLYVLFAGALAGMLMGDAIALGILLPVVSTVGDLAESIIKRDAALKDSGHSIPGIGGVLDLIDSILFTAPTLYFYLHWIALRGW